MASPATRITPSSAADSAGRAPAAAPIGGPSFADILASQPALRFSSHAQQRLAKRGIDLDQTDLARLTSAVDQASAKGGHESLILLDELALIVSVDNRTVITAMNTGATDGQVFTNVDSVVIAPHRAE